MSCIGLNPDVGNQVANKIIEAIEAGWGLDGLQKINRSYVGMGPVPSEDCCPDLVVWLSNVRMFDADQDTLREGRILKHYGIAFDINVRIGLCFFEMDNGGELVELSQVQGWAEEINRYGMSAYQRAVSGLMDDPQLQCSFSITPQPMYPFQDGGCAGYTFAIGIGVV